MTIFNRLNKRGSSTRLCFLCHRRWIWRDSVEVQHVSPKQLILTRLANDSPPLTVTTKHAPDIFNVRFIGEYTPLVLGSKKETKRKGKNFRGSLSDRKGKYLID